MPIFSLPSNYGIGTLGKEAYKFVDFLKEAKQKYWQILPIGPISYGDSPYSSFSTYAGNPYYIDLDLLVEDGLLKKSDLKKIKVKKNTEVDYEYLYNNRFIILYKAYQNGYLKDKKKVDRFIFNNFWVKDYALFMAIKKHFNMKSWKEWPDNDIRFRKQSAIKYYSELLKDDIQFYSYLQYLFFKQFNELKKYINKSGIKLIGDIPIYVPLDSSDCWSNPKCFQLDDNYIPTKVSGVPPDYFSKDGQLWGNPLYDWNYMKKNNYKWWIDRLSEAGKIYDIVRIDHFRGFEAYWAVPYGAKTAKNGKWIKGPNMDFLNIVKKKCKNIEFISEDLGYHTDGVQKMLDEFGYPGMKVLEFGFDSRDVSNQAPHAYTQNCVCYIGTHDNSTAIGWFKNSKKEDANFCKKYLGLNKKEGYNWGLIRAGMCSPAVLFVTQLQDYLSYDDKCRINIPGTLGCNWKWRLEKGKLTKTLSKKIAQYTYMYGRSNYD